MEIVLIIFGLVIAVAVFLRIKDKGERLQQQAILTEQRPVIIKRYVGSQAGSYSAFQKDAAAMATRHYFPASQSWVSGQWSGGDFLVALLLCLILIGIIVFIYMLIVRPNGTLTVTYELRSAHAKEKICPKCAETVKAAASVCRFCGYQFTALEKGEAAG